MTIRAVLDANVQIDTGAALLRAVAPEAGGFAPAAGQITALASMTGIGAALAASEGQVTATAQLLGAAQLVVPAAGSISAQASVSGAGARLASASGAINAAAALAGVGAATAEAAGTMIAQATVTGVSEGAATVEPSALIEAAASVAGVGEATAEAAGAMAATSALNGAGAALAEAVGSIAATSSVTGAGAATADASGLIEAVATASAAGAAIAAGQGTVAAASSMSGVGAATASASGLVEASATVAGVGEAVTPPSGPTVAYVGGGQTRAVGFIDPVVLDLPAGRIYVLATAVNTGSAPDDLDIDGTLYAPVQELFNRRIWSGYFAIDLATAITGAEIKMTNAEDQFFAFWHVTGTHTVPTFNLTEDRSVSSVTIDPSPAVAAGDHVLVASGSNTQDHTAPTNLTELEDFPQLHNVHGQALHNANASAAQTFTVNLAGSVDRVATAMIAIRGS